MSSKPVLISGNTVSFDLTTEEGRAAQAAWDKKVKEDSHLEFFAKKTPVVDGKRQGLLQPTQEEVMDIQRRIQRHKSLAQNVASVFMANRVIDAHGPNVKKIPFKEYESLFREYTAAHREGVEIPGGFRPASTYLNLLRLRPDGSLRDRPLRNLLQNEVGMIGDVVIVLADAGPDDAYGEGHWFQVHKDTPVDRTVEGGYSSEDGKTERLKK
jgi:hypothetical protein